MTSFDMDHNHAFPDKNQQGATNTSQPNQQSGTPSEKLDTPLEIKAAEIGAEATWRGALGASVISILGSVLTGLILFQITQVYQGNDGRQKALNEYVNSMKELIVSTQIDRTSNDKIAPLKYSKTLLAMRELDEDGDRKGQVIRFLQENSLLPTSNEKDTCSGFTSSGEFALCGANLDGIVLEDAWIPNVNLMATYMRGANLQKADLSGADLRAANLSPNQKTVLWGILPFLKGISANANLKNTKLYKADLSQADLSQADLSQADLSQADLRFTKLVGANLTGTNLSGACYIEGTETTYFPESFNPREKGMVPMTREESNPEAKATYKSCIPFANP